MAGTVKALSVRQARQMSVFRRPMSIADAFIYNFLSMGVIFPWVYLWGGSFQGGSVALAIFVTLLVQLPISVAYCFLAVVLPVAGGDYVYQTRAFGKWGFVSVMSGFVIWILQWVAVSGWLFATLGLAPVLLSIGVLTGSSGAAHLGLLVQTPSAVFVISVLLAVVTTVFLANGLSAYLKIQWVLFFLTVSAIAAVVFVFASTSPATLESNIASFFASLIRLTGTLNGTPVPDAASANVVKYLISEASSQTAGIVRPFSFVATLCLVPIAWTSLQWATYSVQQSTEIDGADHFGKQLWMLVAPAVAVTICLWAVAIVERAALSKEFVAAASLVYQSNRSGQSVEIVTKVIQPFPNVLAMTGSGSVWLSVIIALGFLANAFQVMCNCFIGMTRIIVAMANDGMLPRRLDLGRVDSRRHSPVRAHWAYFGASVPWIAAYNYFPDWRQHYTLGVTLACGYVFALSALAATRIPTTMRTLWLTSEIRKLPGWLIQAVGFIAFGLAAVMVLALGYLLPGYGWHDAVPYLILLILAGIIAASYALFVLARSKYPHIDETIALPPAEVGRFYE